jgi:iron-sulfur cluster repair protein YtfE (RIC family)
MPRHASLIPLSHDHREALGLAFFLHNPAPPGRGTAMTPASTPQSRRARTLAFFEASLASHLRAEEDALFPALHTHRALVVSLVADHRRLETLRDALAAADTEAAVETALVEFADLLETHVRREERELFAGFPEPMDAAQADAIGGAIRAVLATDRGTSHLGDSS